MPVSQILLKLFELVDKLKWLTSLKDTKLDLDRRFSWPPDLEKVDIRTRRLAADLLNLLRPTLAIQPHRENAYVALDAVAWATAIILVGTEDPDALDFFTLALTQNLAELENPDPPQTDSTPPAAPEVAEKDIPDPHEI